MYNRVLIVDDHPVVLYGLRVLFEGHQRFTICGDATDSAMARAQATALKPDFVILDLVLGGRDGIDLVRDIATSVPSARILVYSSQTEWRFARSCIQAGAYGYVSKTEGLPVVADALEFVADGQTFISEAVRARLSDRFGTDELHIASSPIEQLSSRELQVLGRIGQGQTTRQIAEGLELSIKTVGTYCERMKVKLQLESLRDLEVLARDYVIGRHSR